MYISYPQIRSSTNMRDPHLISCKMLIWVCLGITSLGAHNAPVRKDFYFPPALQRRT